MGGRARDCPGCDMASTRTGDGDEQNLAQGLGDKAVAGFYERFPYPKLQPSFEAVADPAFHADFLNQSFGDWSHSRVPVDARVWVAGCGTTQAAATALRFPLAAVVGSDISVRALQICRTVARQLGIENLVLDREGMEEAMHREAFDYVLCTGVIHHLEDPLDLLRVLARALAPNGVLELMVYNRFHRIWTSAFQRAIGLLAGSDDLDEQLALARVLADHLPADNELAAMLCRVGKKSDVGFADHVINPRERSYTVESLAAIAHEAGLELLQPCVTDLYRTLGQASWRLELGDRELQRRYEALSDLERWQVTNLLLAETSPILRFYMQRRDTADPRRSEREVDDGFLETVFEPSMTKKITFRWDGQHYVRLKRTAAFPQPHADERLRRIVEAADGRRPMRDVLATLGEPVDCGAVTTVRTELATASAPYLRARTTT